MIFVAKTLFGLEEVLSEELRNIGASDISLANRAVIFSGDKQLLYRANYMARTAMSVLMQIADFRIRSADDLYNNGLKIGWDRYLSTESTFSVVPVVNSDIFSHTGFAGLRLKDVVADFFRKKSGRRPTVDTSDPEVIINLHISHDHVTISLDSSGSPLFKRGYRAEQSEAPLNEVLAAGILLLSGWDGSAPLLDPMCGSGTIPVEAGLIACRIPPGKLRQSFGFRKWKDFDKGLFEKVKAESDERITNSNIKIAGRDISGPVVELARNNVAKAGLSGVVTIDRAGFEETDPPFTNGLIFMNPPYGQRMQPENIESLYRMLGNTLKHKFPGFTAFIITSYPDAVKNIGLKARDKKILFNGALKCSLLKYELYEGSKKTSKQAITVK